MRDTSRTYPAARAMCRTASGSGNCTRWDYCAAAFAPPTASSPSAAISAIGRPLIESAGTYIQRMQKALVQMNLQLPLVVSDITGVTGLRILRDIVAGHCDPQALAEHRDHRC